MRDAAEQEDAPFRNPDVTENFFCNIKEFKQ
jgi:hypothetical protein